MNSSKYNTIGVMSGTSLDGIDLARVVFTLDNNKWNFEIFETQTIPYPDHWVETLKNAVHFSTSELDLLDKNYTRFLAKVIADFIAKNNLTDLDAICSHGHTILHQPNKGFTLQIGNLPILSELLNNKVVCNFRVQDVALGGQGAPLVPIGDQLLFADFDYCLNLGGFSNISFLYNNKRIAFDISPVNTVLNHLANQLGLAYDDKGNLAKNGNLNPQLLQILNQNPFYKQSFPKSLGIEFVKSDVFPILENSKIDIADKMHTYVVHIAQQIANALPSSNGKLLITGGGAYNQFLIENIQKHLPKLQIVIPNKTIIEFKEALIFAFLGVLKLENQINTLSSVTGASKDHSAGIIFG